MHVAAAGPLKTLLIILAVAALALVFMTLSGPYSAEYEVKTAAKIVCNTLIQNQKYKLADNRSWEAPFVNKARVAGVALKPGQYDFEVRKEGENWLCDIKVAWRSSTMVPILSDYFTMQPLQIVHRIDYTHKVLRNY